MCLLTNAATIIVTTTADTNNAGDGVTSLREAISSALEGDTITFAPSLNGQPILLRIDDYPVFGADLNHAISIVGNGIENTIINGNSTRLFNVNAGTVASPIVISGLTITGGGGDDGGGIYVSAGAVLRMHSVSVSNNTVGFRGAGLYNAGRCEITDSIISNNKFSQPISVASQVEVVNFDYNYRGGGIYNAEGASLLLRNVDISKNIISKMVGGVGTSTFGQAGQTYVSGGGICNAGELSIVGGTISENSIIASTLVYASYSLISAHSFAYGGGVFNEKTGSASLVNVTFLDNSVMTSSSAMGLGASNETYLGMTFASSYGSGFCNAGTATVANVSFVGNDIACLSMAGAAEAGKGNGVVFYGGAIANAGTMNVMNTYAISNEFSYISVTAGNESSGTGTTGNYASSVYLKTPGVSLAETTYGTTYQSAFATSGDVVDIFRYGTDGILELKDGAPMLLREGSFSSSGALVGRIGNDWYYRSGGAVNWVNVRDASITRTFNGNTVNYGLGTVSNVVVYSTALNRDVNGDPVSRVDNNTYSVGAYAVRSTPEAHSTVVTTIDDIIDAYDDIISLREAIAYATDDADTPVAFDATLNNKTVTLTTEIVIPSGMTIAGNGVGETRISGGGTHRIFNIQGGTTTDPVDIQNLTLSNGCADQGGAISLRDYGVANINTVLFTQNTVTNALNGGGAIKIGTGSKMTVQNSKFADNTTVGHGGAFFNYLGTANISGTVFTNNSAWVSGGAVRQSGGTSTFDDCDFVDNGKNASGTVVAPEGGAIFAWLGTVIVQGGSTFTNNASKTSGGAIYVSADTTLNVNQSSFYGNASGQGGAVSSFGATTVASSVFNANSASNASSGGGAIRTNSGTSLTVQNSTFFENTTPGHGGAIFNYLGTANVSGTTFSNNTGTTTGGAVRQSGGTSTFDDCDFRNGNSAYGGAICTWRGQMTVRNGSTFTGNHSTISGGALCVNQDTESTTTLTVSDSTFSDNVTAEAGGAIYNQGTATITRTTMSDNSAMRTINSSVTLTAGTPSVTETRSSYGGAIYNSATGTLAVKESAFSGNNVDVSAVIMTYGVLSDTSYASGIMQAVGGAIYNAGAAAIETSVFNENFASAETDIHCSKLALSTAIAFGGAVCNGNPGVVNGISAVSGTSTIVNSSFSKNSTETKAIGNIDGRDLFSIQTGSGGAIYSNGSATIADVSIVENRLVYVDTSYITSRQNSQSGAGVCGNAAAINSVAAGNCTQVYYVGTLGESNFSGQTLYASYSSANVGDYFQVDAQNNLVYENNIPVPLASGSVATGGVLVGKIGDVWYSRVAGAANWTQIGNVAVTIAFNAAATNYGLVDDAVVYSTALNKDAHGIYAPRSSHDVGYYVGAYGLKEIESTRITSTKDVVDPYDGVITLREAILYAADGDTVTFGTGLGGETIALNEAQVNIDKSLTIDASSLTGGITIKGSTSAPAFYVDGGDDALTLSMIGFTLTGNGISVASVAEVCVSNLTVDVSTTTNACAFAVASDAIGHLTLGGVNTFASGYGEAGLCVPVGATLFITNALEDTAAELRITGGVNGAGLGGRENSACGSVTLSGGTITAVAGYSGAGIGGGKNGAGGNVTISGGAVTASGGTYGAGIGGGFGGGGGTLTVSGGTVVATRGNLYYHDIGGWIDDDGVPDTTYGANIFTGGSIHLTNGSITNLPVNTLGERVYCVAIPNLTANTAVVIPELPDEDYGLQDVVADANGIAYLWLTASLPSSSEMPSVPFAWIVENFPSYIADGDYYGVGRKRLRSSYSIEEAYLIGVTNEDDTLTITELDFSTDPVAVVFVPSNTLPQVKYAVEGKANLSDDVWTPQAGSHRFFRINATWEK